MKKLMPMTDFVLEQNNIQEEGIIQAYNKIVAYAEFLKQPLTLGMFVPVDEEGNVLEEPSLGDCGFGSITRHEQYKKAKEKVLFEGFEIKVSKIHEHREFIGWEIYNSSIFINIGNGWQKPEYPDYHIIEDLIKSNESIELTPSALKQIGL